MSQKPNNGTQVNSLPNGQLELKIIRDGKDAASIEFAPRLASSVALQLFIAAKVAHQRSGNPAPDRTQQSTIYPAIVPTSAGLGPSPEQGCECIVFSFGETEIGFSLPKDQLAGLGQALVALSASGPKQ